MASAAKRLKRLVRYALLRCAMAIVSVLPLRLASALGAAFGSVAYLLLGAERRKALASLARAQLPASLARDCFRHLGRCAFELPCLSKIDEQIWSVVDWPAADRVVLEQALAAKKGVVFVTAHAGNWELLARAFCLAGYDTNTIAKETSDPRTTALIERFRESVKLHSIWRGRDGAAKEMMRVLRRGAVLGLLIDQDTDVQSVWVDFFGHRAKTPRGAADLALRTGAPVVMGFCTRVAPCRYRVTICDVPVQGDAVALTAELTRRIEQQIRSAPDQWVWMHQRWKSASGQ